MKQYWQRLVLRIDALSLRERAMIFLAATGVLLGLVNTLLLEPQFEQQKRLSQKLKQEQAQTALIQNEIQQKLNAQKIDPDIANRERLRQLQQQSAQMQSELLVMQKGLVSPDRMTVLLEDILRRNGKLRLVSLKTLPVVGLDDAADKVAAVKDKVEAATIGASVYRHGVEIVVQGGYLDMMQYMTELEAMPWQLFWGKAKLHVDEYPKATLTLTLYTLSLDKKWLNL